MDVIRHDALLTMKVTLHSRIHEWRETTEDGRARIVRASWDGRTWMFEETFKDAPDWTRVTSPKIENFEELRDVLWRKYQRNRVPWHMVEHLDGILKDMREAAGPEASESSAP